MAGDPIAVLCTGDIHLGRTPSAVPQSLDGQQFSPNAVWRSIVDEAITREVDLVALTGDVVDRENRYYEAYGDLERGVSRLAEAGIDVVAVAGNHDYDVFPRLVRELEQDALHLLGPDGSWERQTMRFENGRTLTLDGWSFPTPPVLTSPLEEYDLEEPDGPAVGLLHADLEATTSEYAPVDRETLEASPLDAWLLGHIHRPRVHAEEPLVLYPGSPQPLDPGERGAHGPWLLSITERGVKERERLPLATLRYDTVTVAVDEASDAKAVPSLIREALEAEYTQPPGPLELLLPRVRLTGRTDAHGALHDQQSSIAEDLALTIGETPVRLESLDLDTRPGVDLADLASEDHPAGYLADLLLTLDEEPSAAEEVIAEALGGLQEVHEASAYRELNQEGVVEDPTREDAVEALTEQARLLLDELLAQREEMP